jgi:radical SAM superfamily enzyme YgiQ (UPF0313 family)
MKVAIFNHPYSDFYSSESRAYAGVTGYLGSIISPKYDFISFDVRFKSKTKTELPDKLSYLKNYLVSDITKYSFFKDYYKFGSEDNFNLNFLKDFNPDIILITSFAYCYFEGFKSQVDYLKQYFDVPIIAGGAGPSSDPLYYLKNTSVDYIIKGPAEISLMPLLDSIKNNRKPVNIANVYSRDFRAFENLDHEHTFKPFINQRKNKISLQLTRGCPKRCTYCSVNLGQGSKYLKAGLSDFKAAIKKCSDNINYVDFEDDNISLDKSYLFECIKLVKKRYPNASIAFENGIDLKTLDKELVDCLVSEGIKMWNISLVSSNNKILKDAKRDYLIDEAEEALDYIISKKLPVIVYFISGLLDDCLYNVLETLYFLASKEVITSVSTFYAVPGIYHFTKDLNPLFCRGTSFYPHANFTTEELVSIFMLSRFLNAIKMYSYKQYYYLLDKDFLIQKGKIFGNLTKDDYTMIGIIYSFYKESFYYVGADKVLKEHRIAPEIRNSFFLKFKEGLTIKGVWASFSISFFEKVFSFFIKRIT